MNDGGLDLRLYDGSRSDANLTIFVFEQQPSGLGCCPFLGGYVVVVVVIVDSLLIVVPIVGICVCFMQTKHLCFLIHI